MVLHTHVAALDPNRTIEARVGLVITTLEQAARADYVGEPISQLDHALQAGALARAAGAATIETVAALLHDVGHLPTVAPAHAPAMRRTPGDGDPTVLGVASHEQIGAAWLDSLGFDPLVGELVAAHVEAKRYLVASRPRYAARLSDASRHTLVLQGGPMNPRERAAFERDPLRDAKLRVRSWDEAAKLPDARVEGLASWIPSLRALIRN